MRTLIRITKYGLRYKWHMVASYVSLTLATVSMMAIPGLAGLAIDEAVAGGTVGRLLLLAGIIVVVAAARGLFTYGDEYLLEVTSQRVAYDLRNDFFNKLQGLSFGFHDRQQTGDLMSRATGDVEMVRTFAGAGFARFLYLFLVLGTVAVLMLTMNWRLGIVSVLVVPLLVWRSAVTTPPMSRAYGKGFEEQGHMATVVQESLAGIRVVKAFGAAAFERGKFERRAAAVEAADVAAAMLSISRIFLFWLALNASLGAVLWVGAYEAVAGRLTAGELAAFLVYVGVMKWPVIHSGFALVGLSSALSAGNRLFEILDAESPVKEKPGAVLLPRVQGHVKFDHVSLTYDATVPALRDISFEAQPGQLIAVLGAPGSGKSTIAHLLPRFYDVSEGRIMIDGQDVRDVTLESLRQNVGIAMQESFAFMATIKENITYGADYATIEDVMRVAKVAQLHDFIDGLEDGYDTLVGERGITLSGGQQQRLGIARTLLVDPPILILDDSTSSVDVDTEYWIQQALAAVFEGRTTFVIAHRLSTVRQADLILVLDRGEIVEQGTHQDLLARNAVYRRIYDMQLRPQQDPESPAQASAAIGGQ